MSQFSNLFAKSIVGLIALAAMGLGVWYSVNQIKEQEQLQALEVAKQVALKNSSQETKNIPVKDVAFLLQLKLPDMQGVVSPVTDSLEKITLVNFWATWCAPCREEMPAFNEVYQENFAKGFGVLGLTIDNRESALAFIKEINVNYPILMAEHEGWDLLTQTGNPKNLMPYSFLIDQKGNILETKLGPLHKEEIEGWIDKYL